MVKERRKFERYSMNVAARIGEENRPGMLQDISAGGIAVVADVEFEKVQKLQICFQIKSDTIVCEGEVLVKLERGGNRVYGIAFLQKFIPQAQEVVKQRKDLHLVQVNKM